MIRSIVLFAIVGSLVILSCQRKNIPAQSDDESVVIDTMINFDTMVIQAQFGELTAKVDTLLWYSRSGCFGKCPVYSFLLQTDSTIIYEGRAYVENEGTFEKKLSSKEYGDWISFIESGQLQTFSNSYPSSPDEWIVDLPTSTIVDKTDSIRVIVRINHSPPDRLKEFKETLENRIQQINWTSY